jgi:hypothetical protein
MINSEINISTKVHTYPTLKRYNGNDKDKINMVVLFTDRNTGVVIYSDNENKRKIGEVRTNWVESVFKLCNESITLKNV